MSRRRRERERETEARPRWGFGSTSTVLNSMLNFRYNKCNIIRVISPLQSTSDYSVPCLDQRDWVLEQFEGLLGYR